MKRFVATAAAALSIIAAPLALATLAALPGKSARAVSSPVGAVVMMAGKTVKGTVPYGERTFRPQDRTLTCVVVFPKPAPGTRVKTEWVAVNAGGMKNTKFNEDELTMAADDNARLFIFTMNKAWPAGKYQVKVFVNGKYDRAIAFNIK